MGSNDDGDAQASDVGVRDGNRLLTFERLAWLVGIACLLVLLVFFIADNFVLVQIRLYTVRIQARLAWALIIPLVLGFGMGWIAHAGRQRLRKHRARKS